MIKAECPPLLRYHRRDALVRSGPIAPILFLFLAVWVSRVRHPDHQPGTASPDVSPSPANLPRTLVLAIDGVPLRVMYSRPVKWVPSPTFRPPSR